MAEPGAAPPRGPAGGGVRAQALRAARLIERGFLPLLVLVVVAAVAVPGPGRALSAAVVPLFAVMMFAVSLTFHVGDVRQAVRDPLAVALAVALVFGPLPLLARLVGPALFGPGVVALGLVLLAALPPDISAPLFTAMGGANTALAAVVNAIATALSPVVLPIWFLALTGLHLEVPVGALIAELVFVVLVPTLAGVGLRTRWRSLGDFDAVWQGAAALVYIALVGIVVSQDAHRLIGLPVGELLAVVAAVLVLNVGGYALGLVPWLVSRRNQGDRLAYALSLGEKEFSVAVAVVFAGGLDRGLLVPAVVAAIVQVVTATVLARLWRHRFARRHA